MHFAQTRRRAAGLAAAAAPSDPRRRREARGRARVVRERRSGGRATVDVEYVSYLFLGDYVNTVPHSAFKLVLRKVTALLPQARTKKEQHLEFCQALADVKDGRFSAENKTEIFDLAALAIFKDLREGMSEEEQEEELVLEDGQLTAQLHHYLPTYWFKALEHKKPAVRLLQLEEWDRRVVQSFNELTREELQSGRPIIGIAQTGSDLSPYNRVHVSLADRVRDGIRDAGGLPLEFPCHPIQETGRRPTAAFDRNLAYLSLLEVRARGGRVLTSLPSRHPAVT